MSFVVFVSCKIHSNVGEAYDTETGVFTAPFAGTYVFLANIRIRNLHVHLLVDNVKTAETFVGDNELVSLHAIVHLNAGQKVRLDMHLGEATGHLPQAATFEKRTDDFPVSQVVVDKLTQKVNQQEAEITELRTLVIKLQAEMSKSRTQVGFYAYHAYSKLSVLDSGTVIFDRTYTNTGSAYDTHSGTFTAPVAGTYAFYLTIRPYTDTGTVVHITVEGATKATAYLLHNNLQATAHTVVHLNAGQRVWARNGSSVSRDLYGSTYSYFSGFLVQADP
nr:hypothetical protein BaRGS_030719 [Batillaria attramentaria]